MQRITLPALFLDRQYAGEGSARFRNTGLNAPQRLFLPVVMGDRNRDRLAHGARPRTGMAHTHVGAIDAGGSLRRTWAPKKFRRVSATFWPDCVASFGVGGSPRQGRRGPDDVHSITRRRAAPRNHHARHARRARTRKRRLYLSRRARAFER